METESTPFDSEVRPLSSITLNANKGADAVDFDAVITKSTIGLGAGDDTLTGQFNTLTTATIAGGKGADTINLSGASTNYAVIAGDRANNAAIDGDGADSIYIGGTIQNSTVYGGGGADSVSWSGVVGSGQFVSLNAGADVFTAEDLLQSLSPLVWSVADLCVTDS